MKNGTLRTWLRSATPAERAELAGKAHTSVNYLAQLAGGHRSEPRLRLALAIVAGAERAHRRNLALPLVTLEGLAHPAVD